MFTTDTAKCFKTHEKRLMIYYIGIISELICNTFYFNMLANFMLFTESLNIFGSSLE